MTELYCRNKCLQPKFVYFDVRLDVGLGRLMPCGLFSWLTLSTGDQSVNVDCLAFSVGRMPDLNDQGWQKGQNFPRARPQFGEFSKGRPNAREGPGHPDEFTYCEILLLDALIKVVFLSPRRCMQWSTHSLMRIRKGCSKIGSISCGHRSVINVHGNRTSRPSIARLGVTCVVAWTVSR